ncbi:MAG: hypothetical protein JSS30_01600 [Verrucomicrobia bacterium]|nr:hypothetical protein [Verrucomicrobiota bacterium]
MISRWLIPGKNLDISTIFSTQVGETSLSQLDLQLDCPEDLEQAKRNLPFLEKEILVGARSIYHARKILEMKGFTIDDKTALVHEKIAALVRRFPKVFDYDIFSEMQHFLVSMKASFKADRQPADISRIISTLYHFRKEIEQREGAKRHLCLKLKNITLHTHFGIKEVVAVFVGLNLNEHELFEERHLLSALGVPAIPGSFYKNDQFLYVEVEKFKFNKGDLVNEIQKRIEQLVPPIFMPRNEEEVMRNILVLSQQLKYLRDIPQMIISFDEQADTELIFTVIIARLVHPESRPITELFQRVDRVKIVGKLRRKVPKEVAVIRIRLPTEDFLREDYSVDLFKARQHLVKEMEQILGEVRDYNGGMIAKQSENFGRLKKLLGKLAKQHELLLQNFFHSISPAYLSSTLDPQLLKILFMMLLDALPKEGQFVTTKKANDYLFGLGKFQEMSVKEKILEQFPPQEVLTVQMKILDTHYLGFICLNPHLTFEEIQPYLVRD